MSPARPTNGNPVDLHVGQRLLNEVGRQKIAIERVAAAFETTVQQVEDMFAGRLRINPERLLRACDLIGKPIQWFYEDYTEVELAHQAWARKRLH